MKQGRREERKRKGRGVDGGREQRGQKRKTKRGNGTKKGAEKKKGWAEFQGGHLGNVGGWAQGRR